MGCLGRAAKIVRTCHRESLCCLQDTLFADLAIYEYMAHEQLAITAWYVAREFADAFDVGLDAATRLASRFPDDPEKGSHVAWYNKLKDGMRPI
jgi:hypothetical protein